MPPKPKPKTALPPLAEKIAAVRNSLGMNQTAFAGAIGTEPSAVSKWEAGKNRPNPEKLARIAGLVQGEDRVFFLREVGVLVEDVDVAPGLKLIAPELRKGPIIAANRHSDNKNAGQKSRQESTFAWDPDLLAFIIDTINAQLEKIGRSPSLGFGRRIANVYAICQREGRWDSAFVLQQFGKVA